MHKTPVWPEPTADALTHSDRLVAEIRRRIVAAEGWISFADYMEAALYAPGLGYYAAGARKFGPEGDFITAPELTPLFAAALARQAAEIMAASAPNLLEAGAGSGMLAADLLLALEILGALPERYAILEVSAELRARQKATLTERAPHLAGRVVWLETLPETFAGLVLGNEVLDAMPVHCVIWQEEDILENGVALNAENRFVWQTRPASGRLLQAAQKIASELSPPLPPEYASEIALAAPAWVTAWGERLASGALLLIDYGFPRHEFYHFGRASGTLMCHYRHRAHADPFYLPGLQDITAHVDFTALAEAAFDAGLDVLGYTSQADFLLNCGILDLLAKTPPDSRRAIQENAAVQKLLMPQEMGELFKVIAFGKGIPNRLTGFLRGDRTHTL